MLQVVKGILLPLCDVKAKRRGGKKKIKKEVVVAF